MKWTKEKPSPLITMDTDFLGRYRTKVYLIHFLSFMYINILRLRKCIIESALEMFILDGTVPIIILITSCQLATKWKKLNKNLGTW
jgi:hypothetical protein